MCGNVVLTEAAGTRSGSQAAHHSILAWQENAPPVPQERSNSFFGKVNDKFSDRYAGVLLRQLFSSFSFQYYFCVWERQFVFRYFDQILISGKFHVNGAM